MAVEASPPWVAGAVAVPAGRDVADPVAVAGLEAVAVAVADPVVAVADPAFVGDVGDATVPGLP